MTPILPQHVPPSFNNPCHFHLFGDNDFDRNFETFIKLVKEVISGFFGGSHVTGDGTADNLAATKDTAGEIMFDTNDMYELAGDRVLGESRCAEGEIGEGVQLLWLVRFLEAFNVTAARSSLRQRAPLADFDSYVRRGEIIVERMKAATPTDPCFTYDDLSRNGWQVSKSGSDPSASGSASEPASGSVDRAVLQAMSQLRITQAQRDNPVITCDLHNQFMNFRGEAKYPLGDGGQYEQIYNTNGSTIIGLSNYSPTYFARREHNPLDDPTMPPLEGDDLKAVIPTLNSWADVTWAVWAHMAGNRAHNLRWIFHDDITTEATQYLMETVSDVAGGDEYSRPLKLPWPGHRYDMRDRNGLALLGSPHGTGLGWLYVIGRKILGERDIEKIPVTVFTGRQEDEDEDDKYFMLWDMGQPRLTISIPQPSVASSTSL
ncbi:MAG: hypothetical protein Q9184_006676 [Pyrenodesmia sp. 2 TL-2023]